MDDIETIAKIIMGFITFLGGGAFFRYVIDRKQIGITDRDGIIAELNKLMEAERKECDKKLDELATANKSLVMRINDLENAVTQLRHSTIETPISMWHKNMNGQFTSVNDAALHEIFAPIGKARTDVIGSTDEQVFDAHIATKLRDAHRSALLSRTKQARITIKLHKDLPGFTALIYAVPNPIGPDALTYVSYLIDADASVKEAA